MFNQTLTAADFGTVGLLVLLEALLSADNALILAIIVRHLPHNQQKKALFYGLAGAFALRLGAILIAVQIISFWWLQAIGAIYLLYLPVKHFMHHVDSERKAKARKAGFWMTVLQAELTDIAFAVDSVLVAVAIEHRSDKVWVVYLGAICGVVLLRFAANVFLTLLKKYPFFDHVAYALVGWAGIKLLFVTGHTFEKWYLARNPGTHLWLEIPEMPIPLFWTGIALICGIGGWLAVRNAKKEGDITHIRDVVEEIDGA